MTNNHIDNPNYIDPNYNIKYVNSLNLDENSPNISGYIKQYENNLNINSNYTTDLSASLFLLKYLDKYHDKPKNLTYDKRQVDINKYYIMKYKSESYILKLIIFFCGLALIGCLFFFKGLISETLYIVYLGFIITIGIIMVVYNIYLLKYRDNQRFDEYDYGYMQRPGTDVGNLIIKNADNSSSDSDKTINSKEKCI